MVAIVYYNQTLGMIFFGLMLICLGGYYCKLSNQPPRLKDAK
jgi:hypothetical protein